MRESSYIFTRLFFVVAVSVFQLGCEEMVDPANTADEAFTMYGHFNPQMDTQAVRVFPIAGLLESTLPEVIDARLFSTDLDTGNQIEWQDSLILFDDVTFGHVFWAPFRAEYEHTYHLEVVRSDGVRADVTTTVPAFSEPFVIEPDTLDFDLVAGVQWPNVSNVIDIVVRYVSNVGVQTVRYGAFTESVDGGRLLQINFREDTRPILFEARRSGLSDAFIYGVGISAVVASGDWVPPDGVFNPNFLVEPGTFSNVEDGFGFVGAGYESVLLWEPSDTVLRYAGFDIEVPN